MCHLTLKKACDWDAESELLNMINDKFGDLKSNSQVKVDHLMLVLSKHSAKFIAFGYSHEWLSA